MRLTLTVAPLRWQLSGGLDSYRKVFENQFVFGSIPPPVFSLPGAMLQQIIDRYDQVPPHSAYGVGLSYSLAESEISTHGYCSHQN